MALTATTTSSLRKEVISVLGMRSPIITYLSPCRSNILYSIRSFESIPETFGPILKAIEVQRVGLPRVIIYCRRYQDCASLYAFFKRGLGSFFTEPCDAPDIAFFQMVDILPAVQMS